MAPSTASCGDGPFLPQYKKHSDNVAASADLARPVRNVLVGSSFAKDVAISDVGAGREEISQPGDVEGKGFRGNRCEKDWTGAGKCFAEHDKLDEFVGSV